MSIIFSSQAKVSHIISLINSLTHGAKCHSSHKALLRTTSNGLNSLLDFHRLSLFTRLELNIKVC